MIYYKVPNTFNGFLTAVFESFSRKQPDVQFIHESETAIFGEVYEVIADEEKAKRVWEGLQKKLSDQQLRIIYVASLIEDPAVLSDLLYLTRKIFNEGASQIENFGDARILNVQQMVRKVEREKHRMMAFVRFKKDSSGLFYCNIEPDFNVLPLISKFFKNRFANQSWLIYDVKRRYGLLYDQTHVAEVTLEKPLKEAVSFPITEDSAEGHFSTLWQDYFKSTNIASRRNMKLHIQHVPRRYWKYLTEKQVF